MANRNIKFSVSVLTKNVELALKRLDKQIQDLNRKLSQTQPGAKQFDNLSGKMDKAGTASKRFSNNLGRLNETGKKTGGMFLNITRYFTGLLAVMSATRAIKDSFNSFVQFNSVLQKNLALSQATEEEYQRLRSQALELGRTTVFTAVQVGELQTSLIKLGFTVNEIESLSKPILNLAAALDVGIDRAGEVVGSISRQFNIFGENTVFISDLISSASVKSSNNLETLAASMKFVGSTANAVGLEVNDTVAILNTLANTGLKGSVAGTALNQALIELNKGNSKVVNSLGFTVSSIDDLNKALDIFEERGYGVSELFQLMNVRSARAVVSLLSNRDALNEQVKAMDNVYGSAERMASIQLDTLAGDIELLKSNFVQLSIQGLQLLNDNFRNLIQNLTDFIDTVRDTGAWLLEHKGLLIAIGAVIKTLIAYYIGIRLQTLLWDRTLKPFIFRLKVFSRLVSINATSVNLFKKSLMGATVSTGLLRKGVSLLNLSFKALKGALLSNPIGILLIGITTLIPLIGKLTNKNKELEESQKNVNDEIDKIEGDEFTAYGKWNKHLTSVLINLGLVEDKLGELSTKMSIVQDESGEWKIIEEDTGENILSIFDKYIKDLSEYDTTALANQIETIITEQQLRVNELIEERDEIAAEGGFRSFETDQTLIAESNKLSEYKNQLELLNVRLKEYDEVRKQLEAEKGKGVDFDDSGIIARLKELEYEADLLEAQKDNTSEIEKDRLDSIEKIKKARLDALNFEYENALILSKNSEEKQLELQNKITIEKIKLETEYQEEREKIRQEFVKKEAENELKLLKSKKQRLDLEDKLSKSVSSRIKSKIILETESIELSYQKEVASIEERRIREKQRIESNYQDEVERKKELEELNLQYQEELKNASTIRINELTNLELESEQEIYENKVESLREIRNFELDLLRSQSATAATGKGKDVQREILEKQYENQIADLQDYIDERSIYLNQLEQEETQLQESLNNSKTQKEKDFYNNQLKLLRGQKERELDVIDKANELQIQLEKEKNQRLKEARLEQLADTIQDFQGLISSIGEFVNVQRQMEEEQLAASFERREQELAQSYETQLKTLGLYGKESGDLTAAQNRRLTEINKAQAEKEKKLEEEKNQQEIQIKKDYAQKEFKIKVATIIADTAAAIMGTWAGYASMGPVGTILAAAQTAALVATGAIQIKQAKQQKQQIASLETGGHPGGLIKGKSHSQGGVKMVLSNGGAVEVEGNEFIVNKRTMSNPKLANMVYKLNDYGNNGKYRKFATGGTLSNVPKPNQAVEQMSREQIRTIVDEVVDGIVGIPVINNANETVTVSENYRKVRNSVTF